ncbi:MAG: hypothetical protein ACRDSK_30515, partial [Actinophytocola sp.]|uniref:hypothetical protein n=1 Tax=Actinophytocola sp. TaxID=1872138 RepID=UPI003D6B902F
GDDTVAGQARPGSAATERLTLPPPVEGDPIAVAGRSTEQLPVVEKGRPVEYDDGSSTLTWRLDSFVDTAEQSAELAAAGVATDDEHRLVLIEITVTAVAKEAHYDELVARTYVVDDRGLMIGDAGNFRSPSCPEREPADELKPGESRQLCLAYRVARTTPVTEVALATSSTRWPEAGTPARLALGARIPVTGQRVDGAPQPSPRDALALGVPHTFTSTSSPTTTADVAVVDLVQNPSGYFDSEPIDLPGTRGVLLRLAVRMPEDAEYSPPLLVQLRDDRGTIIDEASSAIVNTQGCTGTDKLRGGAGVQQVCHLFAVPTGTPVRDVAVSIHGADETTWLLP